MCHSDIKVFDISSKDLARCLVWIAELFPPAIKPFPFDGVPDGHRQLIFEIAVNADSGCQHIAVLSNVADPFACGALNIREVGASVASGAHETALTTGGGTARCSVGAVTVTLPRCVGCTTLIAIILSRCQAGVVVTAEAAVTGVAAIPTMIITTEPVDGGWALNWVILSTKVANAWGDDVANASLGMLVDACCQSMQAEMRGQVVVVNPLAI